MNDGVNTYSWIDPLKKRFGRVL